jgi:hypothetical protein
MSARSVAAQRIQPEARVDVLGPRASFQPGAGITAALGTYARIGANVGYAVESDRRFAEDHWRGDVIARVTLDPFRQQRWGFSAGAGLSVQRRTYLAVVVDLEGPAVAGMLPALQVGLSGGVRGGVVLRRAVTGRR